MDEQYVITISHQLGCGGAYIGKKLSEALSVPFVDRQILKRVADYFNLSEADVESREEKRSSFWEIFYRGEMLIDPVSAIAQDYMPTDKELYDLEMQYIEKIANKSSSIILGRGGNYILRNHPRHLSVFLSADMKDRIQRVCKLYDASESESRRIIEKNDKERSAYIKAQTGLDTLNVKSYDICVNTSSVGLDNAAQIIKSALDYKMGLSQAAGS
jgi:Cytidylate kinase